MNRTLPALLIFLIFLFALVFNCGGGGDSDDGSSSRDQTEDNDSDDDDVMPGGGDDDDAKPAPPVLSNAYFEPATADVNEDGDGVTHLNIDVCDPNNDLLPDGRLTLSSTVLGTTEYRWDAADLLPGGDLEEVDDCANPVSVGMIVQLPIPFPFTLCIDAVATDSAGNVSNEIKDICAKFRKPD